MPLSFCIVLVLQKNLHQSIVDIDVYTCIYLRLQMHRQFALACSRTNFDLSNQGFQVCIRKPATAQNPIMFAPKSHSHRLKNNSINVAQFREKIADLATLAPIWWTAYIQRPVETATNEASVVCIYIYCIVLQSILRIQLQKCVTRSKGKVTYQYCNSNQQQIKYQCLISICITDVTPHLNCKCKHDKLKCSSTLQLRNVSSFTAGVCRVTSRHQQCRRV